MAKYRALIRIIRARSLIPGNTIVIQEEVERIEAGRMEFVKIWRFWNIESVDVFGSSVVLILVRRFEGKIKDRRILVTPPDSYQKMLIAWVRNGEFEK